MCNARITILCGTLLLVFANACGDDQVPTWPADAGLSQLEVEDDKITLVWPKATDDSKVEHYLVVKDGEVIEKVPATRYRYEVRQLEQSTEYRLAVRARDESGNESEPLELTVLTADRTAPVWPEGAALTIEEHPAVPEIPPCNKPGLAPLPGTVGLNFSWPAATDDQKVTAYRIRKGVSTLARVDGETTTHQLITAAPDGKYEVEAGDGSGNWSRPLSVTRKSSGLTSADLAELGIAGLINSENLKLPGLFTDKIDTDPGPAAGLGALLQPGQPPPGFDLTGKLEPPAAPNLAPGLPGPPEQPPASPAGDNPSDTTPPVR